MATQSERYKKWLLKNPERYKEHQRRYRRKNRAPCRECDGLMPFPSPGAKYCSGRCRKEASKRAAKNYRTRAIQAFHVWKKTRGCQRCGYNQCGAALDFHHVAQRKGMRLTAVQWKTNSPRTQRELEKCVLLCANCHREEHFNG